MHYSSDEPHASPISIINRMAINCRTANIWFEQPSLSQSKCKQCPHKGDKFMGSLMRTTLLYITHTINIHLWFVGFKIVCITYNTHTHTRTEQYVYAKWQRHNMQHRLWFEWIMCDFIEYVARIIICLLSLYVIWILIQNWNCENQTSSVFKNKQSNIVISPLFILLWRNDLGRSWLKMDDVNQRGMCCLVLTTWNRQFYFVCFAFFFTWLV